MNQQLNVLIVGDMRPGTNSRSLAEAFINSGASCRTVDYSFIFQGNPRERLLISRFRRASAQANANLRQRIREATEGFCVDLLIAIKTIYFDQNMLLDIGKVRAHYSFDDVSNKRNITREYLKFENAWDCIVTTKRHNIDEISVRGGRPLFQWAAYDPKLHRTVTPHSLRKYDLGFIGAMRPDRADLPEVLGSYGSLRTVVAGPRWDRRNRAAPKSVEVLPAQMGDAYTRIANQIKVGLVLLNSENRDQHTNRSIETPMTGQLVLAQNTPEHRELFTHGESALLFDELELALGTLPEILNDEARSASIAQLGHERIAKGGFTYLDRAQNLLKVLAQ